MFVRFYFNTLIVIAIHHLVICIHVSFKVINRLLWYQYLTSVGCWGTTRILQYFLLVKSALLSFLINIRTYYYMSDTRLINISTPVLNKWALLLFLAVGTFNSSHLFTVEINSFPLCFWRMIVFTFDSTLSS